ncbi:MAG: LytTR family DNA-binding domain-containing protein [Bacteroidia bacterium]|nr:LytTR family DNA-binding domain-containing protein [Bacteroidia bacterium]MCF8425650.1 LytTR family DNA-binding domain-containing protein [Bacteroidia bacterium]MCF8446835.1 LytTR family DNA-binding domain-containing protein [Bacteroidia bacterium]
MRAYLLDDELSALEVLEIYLEKHFPQIEIVGKNTKPVEAIDEIGNLEIDLLFIDVQMPKLNGFEVIEQLAKPWPMVIFTTAYDKFAIEAIKFSALYYLLKPINIQELKVAIEKAEENLRANSHGKNLEELLSNLKFGSNQKSKIAIRNNDAIEYLEVNEIIRCEADNNYTKIYLTNSKRLLVSKTLKEFESILEMHDFVRIHQSHLINKEHLKRYIKSEGGTVILSDGTELPVARARKDSLNKSLNL